MTLHLRWLTTEKIQNYETVKGGCIPSKNKLKTQKFNKSRWLASDINFKLLHTGCPNAHGFSLPIYSNVASVGRSIVDYNRSSFPLESQLTKYSRIWSCKETKFNEDTILF